MGHSPWKTEYRVLDANGNVDNYDAGSRSAAIARAKEIGGNAEQHDWYDTVITPLTGPTADWDDEA